MKFANNITFFFIYLIFLMYFFNRILSYFAKPNYIIYDKFFDEKLNKRNFILKINK